MNQVPEPTFLNVEYLFYLIYKGVSGIFTVNWLQVMYVGVSLVTIGLIIVILFALVRLYEMKQEDKKKENADKKSEAASGATAVATTSAAAAGFGDSVDGVDISAVSGAMVIPPNPTWDKLRERLLSDNPTDWRLAIIEADIYMDRQLDAKGWHGDTIGDKLKQLTPVELPSIQLAWEAHKVRNRIAHDLDYILTMPEARRTLSYYEIVFRDLHLIP